MNLSSFIWAVADLLRGKYKPHEYGQVILPFTVLRRMDCVLEPTKKAVLKEVAKREFSAGSVNPFLTRASGATFYNTSPMDLKAIIGDQDKYRNGGAVDIQFFRVHEFHGDLTNRIFNDMRWTTMDTLPSFDFLAADQGLIRDLADGKLL